MAKFSRWSSRGYRGDLLALLAGGLLPFAFAPLSLYPLALLLPALLGWLWLAAETPRLAFRRGFLFGIGQFGVGISWVYVAIDVYGQGGLVVATLLTLALVGAMALYPALVGYLAVRLRNRLAVSMSLFLLALLPALWFLGEALRGWLFTGFPWLVLGVSQTDSPLAGWAALVGGDGLSLLLWVAAGALVLTATAKRPVYLLVPLLLLLAGWGLGRVEWSDPTGRTLRVAIVQGNQPQLTKWDSDKIRQRLTVYAGMTRQALADSDLVVWPENAITVYFNDYRESYFEPLAERARELGRDIIVGVPLRREGGGYYTTLTSIGSSGVQHYRKSHLVPFGEYLPFDALLRGMIDFFDLPMSSFSAGADDQPSLRIAGERAAVTICYEDAFSPVARRNLPEATLLLNGSNNAWYGDSLAPHQHLQISRMRAIESDRPVIRATTNGISALIGPDGSLIATSRQFETELLRSEIEPRSGATPYLRGGYLVPWLATLLLAIGLGWRWRRC